MEGAGPRFASSRDGFRIYVFVVASCGSYGGDKSAGYYPAKGIRLHALHTGRGERLICDVRFNDLRSDVGSVQ
jgi:hypothetical protein